MGEDRTESWEALASRLETYDGVPAAQAAARLLRRMPTRWHNTVTARGSMHDILFTPAGDRYPFGDIVRVQWREGVYEFHLSRRGLLVTADRSHEEHALAVLEAFLHQLAGP